MISLVSGVSLGLIFGERCAIFSIAGDAFVQLLQMTVMPYIVVSLIHGIGSLDYTIAKKLAWKGGLLLLAFWGVALLFVIITPFAFPAWKGAGFYSATAMEAAQQVDFLKLYIPANPFYSMSEGLVPAVVLFSICFGVTLIGMKGKEKIISQLEVASNVLTKLTGYVVYLTPIGVFCITASAAGTMTVSQLGRIQVYFISYLVLCILISMVILPLLVTMFTPFSYREVVTVSKDAFITAFITENLLIVLPVMAKGTKKLFEKHQINDHETDLLPDVIMPITFNFPNIAKLLFITFISFGAWYIGKEISTLEYFSLIPTGFLSLFGSTNVALPFLLNYMHLPEDLFEIYLLTGILTRNFATLLGAVNLFTFTILCAALISGRFKINYKRMVLALTAMSLLTIGSLGGVRLYFSFFVKPNKELKQQLGDMQISNPVKTRVIKKLVKAPHKHKDPASVRQIKKRGFIRVGYNANVLPFAYFGRNNKLVGYDIAMANYLARDLGVKLEFVPITFDALGKYLNSGMVDIVMSSVSITNKRLTKMAFTKPVMRLHMAVLIKDYDKAKFKSIKAMKQLPFLRVAVLKGSAYTKALKETIPDAEIIEINKYNDFLKGKVDADCLLTNAERGAAWTIIHPAFRCVVPEGIKYLDLVAYAMQIENDSLHRFMDLWFELKQASGVTDKLYSYWILGKKTPAQRKPRWCLFDHFFENKQAKEPEKNKSTRQL